NVVYSALVQVIQTIDINTYMLTINDIPSTTNPILIPPINQINSENEKNVLETLIDNTIIFRSEYCYKNYFLLYHKNSYGSEILKNLYATITFDSLLKLIYFDSQAYPPVQQTLLVCIIESQLSKHLRFLLHELHRPSPAQEFVDQALNIILSQDLENKKINQTNFTIQEIIIKINNILHMRK
nr:hypothetical protein [Bacteroidota bacterium]